MFRRPIVILIALYLLLGLIYAASTPIFEASDEIWHYAVVRELVTHHKLPVQTPGQETTWVQEGSQPPLYYLLGALVTAGVDISDYEENRILNPFPKIGRPGATDNVNLVAHPPGQSPMQGGTTLAVYLIRWLSLLMGAGTVYFAWRLARTLAPGRDALALLAAALVAFNPMVIFINASVNNDNLLMLLSTLSLWLIARELTDPSGLRWRDTLLLSIAIGLAMLTKLSGAILLPVAALAMPAAL
jgi:4-amino-4-deoxy-L-arabinose transferase-like glycosyltransferase